MGKKFYLTEKKIGPAPERVWGFYEEVLNFLSSMTRDMQLEKSRYSFIPNGHRFE